MADDPNDPAGTEPTPAPNAEANAPADPPADPPQDDPAPNGDDPGTILNGDPAGDPPAAAPADWPEDWRQKLAGDDAKELKRLERFKSPQDVVKSWRALEQRMSSGEVKPTLPKDATEEQIAAYRKDAGIPETPEGYLERLEGVVIGEDDKPMVEGFLAKAHETNADPAFVNAALDWYYQTQEDQATQRAEADREFRKTAEDELRAEWGQEYRANINSAMAFLDTAPTTEDGESFKDLLMGARLADGTPFGNHPAALKWLVQLANDANPAGFVSPGAGTSQAQSVDDEIASIEKTMRENRAAYDKDEKMQKRLRDLYAAQEKLSSRAA